VELIVGANQYGKAEVRIVAVDRSSPWHTFDDLCVGITLSGELDAVHRHGDNANVVPTDTQKNTVFAFARETGIGTIEEFGLRLARHFVSSFHPITRARVSIEAARWGRIAQSDGAEQPHSFVSAGSDLRTATAVVAGGRAPGEWVLSGVRGLIVLKTTGSEFSGYVTDRYTTLSETDDRILSTSINAGWRHSGLLPAGEWDQAFSAARAALLARFAEVHSLSLQQTLYEMAAGAVAADPSIAEVRLSMPNRHHFLADLTPYGLDNPNQVYRFEDRPYGLIEAQILVPGAPDAGPAWDPYPLV
jgi:urate oxidase